MTSLRLLLKIAAIFLLLGFFSAEGTAAGEPPRSADQLPLVIPHPQAIENLSSQNVTVGRDGRSVTRVLLAANDDLLTAAGRLWASELERSGFAGGDGHTTCTLRVLTAAELPAAGNAPPLTAAERDVLAKSEQAYVIRMRPGPPSEIDVVGTSPLGAYYGVTTLVQLVRTNSPPAAVVPHVAVRDYPDIPYRMAADWVLTWDWEVNGYDWGDGLDAFVARVKRKIDLCSRFKVNQVRFLGGRIAPGLPEGDERHRLTQKFARKLNRYARSKGVALQYSAVSWGVDYYDWGVPYPRPWILNRHSYPDGEVYACIGGTAGCCLSNEALSRKIAERYKPLVREWEPGSIYLHHIDVAKYRELEAIWRQRCPDCRRLYPEDEPASPHGMAAAVASLYNLLIAELKSVRCPDSDYDPSRDLQIVLASPGYSYADESDADWDQQLAFWGEIARQVTDKQNVRLTFREQYKRLDNRGLRVEEMARNLTQAGWPDAMFVFAAQGGDFLFGSHMLVSSPVLTDAFRGSGVLYNFNGHAFSEVQVLANANYAWNHRAPGWVDPEAMAGVRLAAEAQRYATGAAHSEYLYGRFLETACARLYGREAAKCMADMFRLERDRGPICPTIRWLERLATNSRYDWQGQAARNLAAQQLVDRAAAVCDPAAKEDLLRLSQCLDVGARFCRLLDRVHHPGPEKDAWRQSVEAGADELQALLEKNFPFQKTEPDGGDAGCWLPLVSRIRRLDVQSPPATAMPAPSPLRETVEQGAATVEVSSVLPGYRAASVLTSDPTGRGWGQDGGWNDATAGQFPDTLEITFQEPRQLRQIDVYTLADQWKTLDRVDAALEFQRYGITDLDIEVKLPDGAWRVARQIRGNRRVLMSVSLDGISVAAVRLRIFGSADNQFSRIVHADLH